MPKTILDRYARDMQEKQEVFGSLPVEELFDMLLDSNPSRRNNALIGLSKKTRDEDFNTNYTDQLIRISRQKQEEYSLVSSPIVAIRVLSLIGLPPEN